MTDARGRLECVDLAARRTVFRAARENSRAEPARQRLWVVSWAPRLWRCAIRRGL